MMGICVSSMHPTTQESLKEIQFITLMYLNVHVTSSQRGLSDIYSCDVTS